MHELPRQLNECGISSEMESYFLCANEIFFHFKEPFFGHVTEYSQVIRDIIIQDCSLIQMFPRPPDGQTAALKCLRCLIRKEIVFFVLAKYFSIIISRFSTMWLWIKSCHVGMSWQGCAKLHPNIDVSTNARIYKLPWINGWGWKGILFSMYWQNIFQFLRAVFSTKWLWI